MEWILGILGFAVGAALAALWMERRCRGQLAQTQQALAVADEKLRSREQELVQSKALIDTAEAKLRDAFASLSADALAKNNEAFLSLAKEKFTTLSTEAAGSL